jgi:2-(1,2-epoxy-1,2-dihydrophenyl)acetyl-CoA isomerase
MRFDASVRVVVIRGAEGCFCAGGDISMMAAKAENLKKSILPKENPSANMIRLNNVATTIREMEKPVIAHLEGAVAGAGLAIAMACDFSYAAEDCKMLFAFVKLGLVPDTGSVHMLAHRVGIPRATELLMTGKTFSGADAASWGIITGAFPADALDAYVEKTAYGLAKGPTLAYAKIKALLNRATATGLQESMLNETEYQMILNRSEDHLEAIEAFMAKRPPAFQGK